MVRHESDSLSRGRPVDTVIDQAPGMSVGIGGAAEVLPGGDVSGRRAVAITRSPAATAARTSSRPKPLEQPEISQTRLADDPIRCDGPDIW